MNLLDLSRQLISCAPLLRTDLRDESGAVHRFQQQSSNRWLWLQLRLRLRQCRRAILGTVKVKVTVLKTRSLSLR